MRNRDELIYDLIFSDKEEFIIDIGEYTDIYKYDYFMDDMKEILKKSKVKIILSSLDVNSKTVTWEIKLKRQ